MNKTKQMKAPGEQRIKEVEGVGERVRARTKEGGEKEESRCSNAETRSYRSSAPNRGQLQRKFSQQRDQSGASAGQQRRG